MEKRNLILFNEQRRNPLIDALEVAGYEIAQDVWHPTSAQLRRTELAWVNFYECPKRPWRIAAFKQRMNSAGVPVLAWNRDAPSYKGRPAWRLWLLSRLKLLDIYMSHSLSDGMGFGEQQLLMPNATDITRYNLAGRTWEMLADPAFYQYDVSFFGGLDAANHRGQGLRVQFFNELAARLDKLGISHYFNDGKGLDLMGQIDLIQRTRINLQYGATCEYPGHQPGGLPERCFGVQACGGFLLSDRRPHSRDSFTLGADYVEFESMDDCVSKIQYYLTHFDEARQLAKAAYQRVQDAHTYAHRATQLVNTVDAWRQHRRLAVA
ncbi:glycosyltransferase [Chitinivorax sp. B]|uniref:glycosyltransferase family protein n=1 Tax=Chitinivorax sp. B TaxID=2502235 RepID=UPI0010F90C88|nr:glycosyltransferase [Chitinivorax sp. B]